MTPRGLFASLALGAVLCGSASGAEIKAVSGAVGLDARERMMQTYSDYNLHLAFANASGEFLADVALVLRDAGGSVVWRGVSEGPLFFARVPKGKYEVVGGFRGKSVARWVEAGARPGPMHYFHWK